MIVRADIVDTGHKYRRAGRIVIDAPVAKIFDIIADPYRHPEFDGSGTVRKGFTGPHRLSEGAKFGMDMRLVVPYRIGNQVKEFDEGRRIAWAHVGGHRWRYELQPLPDGGTQVTETFDATTARSARALKVMDAYRRNARAIEETLPRLKALAEGER